MNCLEFESQLQSLARAALLEARTRVEAEAHAAECDTCAARLADERALSSGLRALASEMKSAEAPARAESVLLAAFRARAAAAAEGPCEAAAATNALRMSGHAPARRWSWAKTFAAASLAAAATLALFVLVRPAALTSGPQQESAGARQQKMIEPPPGDDGSGLPSKSNIAQAVSSENEKGQSASAGSDGAAASTVAGAFKVNASRTAFASRPRAVNAAYDRSSAAQPPALAANAGAQEEEVATEFIPLVQAGPYAQPEESHLVRVELPRAALASFGLPVNAEAAGERVKADVLMGQDGIARAIRFVR